MLSVNEKHMNEKNGTVQKIHLEHLIFLAFLQYEVVAYGQFSTQQCQCADDPCLEQEWVAGFRNSK